MSPNKTEDHEPKPVLPGQAEEADLPASADISGIINNLQIISDYLSQRDTLDVSKEQTEKYFSGSADVIVLFGASILHGLYLFAKAIKEHPDAASVIVGGYGHTSATLISKIEKELNHSFATEAEALQALLMKRYNLQADYLETKSTNCGNNITFLLDLLQEQNIPCQNIILIQDASMQRRMTAGLKKYAPDMHVLNYACSQVKFDANPDTGEIIYIDPPEGMWDMDRYITLMLGDIQRLQDNESGYGPKGKNYIAHVDIPDNVLQAWKELACIFPDKIRSANPAYAG